MELFTLQKDRLKDFLKTFAGKTLIAPVKQEEKTQFEPVADIDAARLDLDNYTATIKKCLFPQTETIFSFSNMGEGLQVQPEADVSQTVVFGIRPCDAKSFVVLDPLFKKDFDDPGYINRREKTLLIGHSCQHPANRCFCPSVAGNPFSTDGLDILLTDIDDTTYYVQAVTDSGSKAVQAAGDMFAQAADTHKPLKENADKTSLSKIKRSVDLKKMHELLPKAFENPVWKEIGNKCIGCGICTYNCPTCHCFDIQDEGTVYTGRRLRVWDSCMYPEFTLHASGENPRHDRSARIRNRMMHKFCYYPLNMGFIGCVGCGRCIEMCPVNEDLIDILNRVRKTVHE